MYVQFHIISFDALLGPEKEYIHILAIMLLSLSALNLS